MTYATKTQIQQIHKYLPVEAKTDKDFKADLVAQFSADGHTSTKELTEDEADQMIASLSDSYAHFALFDKNSKQHRLLLALCHQTRNANGDMPYLRWSVGQKRFIPDLDALGRWMATRSKYKKPLSRLSPQQTGVVIEQFKKVTQFGYAKVSAENQG